MFHAINMVKSQQDIISMFEPTKIFHHQSLSIFAQSHKSIIMIKEKFENCLFWTVITTRINQRWNKPKTGYFYSNRHPWKRKEHNRFWEQKTTCTLLQITAQNHLPSYLFRISIFHRRALLVEQESQQQLVIQKRKENFI